MGVSEIKTEGSAAYRDGGDGGTMVSNANISWWNMKLGGGWLQSAFFVCMYGYET